MSDKYRELLDRKPNVFKRDKYAREKKPTVTSNDYDVGYINRYFAKRYDDEITKLVEIDKQQFDSWTKSTGGLKRSYYNVLRIQWKITGMRDEVISINYNTVKSHKDSFKGLENKITDMLEFWKGKKRDDQSVSFFEAKQLLENENNRDGR